MSLLNPLLPVRPGWSRVHAGDLPRVMREAWLGVKPLSCGLMVLDLPYGGIGDHLFYTALLSLVPERIGEIQISLNSADNYGGRLFDLIWKGHAVSRAKGWRHTGFRPNGGNFCDGMVAQITGKIPKAGSTYPLLRRRTARPKYYATTPYVVIDLNRRSNQDRLEQHWEWITRHLNSTLRRRYANHAFVVYASPVNPHGRTPEADLGDYFQMIEHCEAFFGCYSGGAVLAAAYRKPAWIYCERKDPAQSFDLHHYVEVG